MFYSGQTPLLQHFQHYAGHFAMLQWEMDRWKPRTVKELLQPGYGGRFTWYATVFSFLIAVIGIIAVVTSVMQTVVAFNAYNLQVKGT
jgi:hypothetical protein